MILKGTTHRIIEVRGEKDCFFEKAVLYLRPEASDMPYKDIREEAAHYTSRLSGRVKRQGEWQDKLLRILVEAVKALLISALTLAVMLMFVK